MMTLLVLVIIFAIFALNFFSKKQNATSNIGESFSLIDQNGNMFFSKNTKKKEINLFWVYLLSRYLSNGRSKNFQII